MERKYVIFSDMHRGVGDFADECLKNKDIIEKAYNHYYVEGFTLIENGDCEELYENDDVSHIYAAYKSIYKLIGVFAKSNRFIAIKGNHDKTRSNKVYFIDPGSGALELDYEIDLNNSIELEVNGESYVIEHGHRLSKYYHFPKLERFLVRHVWRSINKYGITDQMASPYCNQHTLSKSEVALRGKVDSTKNLIIGHTHQSKYSPANKFYNSGSAIHPSCVQCLEITKDGIKLIKWVREIDDNGHVLYVRSITAEN